PFQFPLEKKMNTPHRRVVTTVILIAVFALLLIPGFGMMSNQIANVRASAPVAPSAPLAMQGPMSCSTPSFDSPAYYAVNGQIPVGVATADFNLDGKPDLATANQTTNNVSVLLGNGSGNYPTAVTFPAGTNPSSVAAADFNRDGKPDLAVSNIG